MERRASKSRSVDRERVPVEPNSVTHIPSVDRALAQIAVFTIFASLVGLGSTLAGVFHAPQVLLASLLLTGWYSYKKRGMSALPGAKPRWIHLALLLILALFFRLPAYHYVLGGQDEGVYVNIAHYIDHTGGIEAHDRIKQELQHTPYIKEYVQDNQVTTDSYLAGVYSRNYKNGKVEFQFYHLLPVWIALFCGIFGATFGVYALTYFALLSIAFFYRLTLLLTESYYAAVVAGLLLALNPLHVFFSKFPVTEVPTLAFSLIGFTLLAAFWSSEPERRDTRWLRLSCLAFLCLFTTRISGFMYVPFFVAMAMMTLVCDKDPQRRRSIQQWAAGVTAAYVCSVIYGLIWSHSYSHDIYLYVLTPLFGTEWRRMVLGLAIGSLCAWIGVGMLAGSVTRREWLAARMMGWLDRLLVIILAGALLLGLRKIYLLGWTSAYTESSFLGQYFHLAGGGWRAAASSSLSTLAVYLGPVLPAFLALVVLRQTDPRVSFLRWFVAGFFVYALVLQWVIPYSPYYARYLLSELIPYLILLVVCLWSARKPGFPRAALSTVLAASILYGGMVSAAQVGKSEDDGAYEALSRLVAPVERNDLILLDTLNRPPDTSLVKTPLVYTFDRNVVTVGEQALSDSGYLAELNSLYDDLFLISSSPVAPRGFTRIDGVRFKVMSFERTHFFPRKLAPVQDIVLNLYRLDRPQMPLSVPQRFGADQPSIQWLVQGWSNPESWGVWSSGTHAVLRIDPRELPNTDHLVLSLDANLFVTPSHPRQRVEISLNGQTTETYTAAYPQTHLKMSLPIPDALLDSARPITVSFDLPDAISPKSLGASGDARPLALGLVSVTALTQPGTSAPQ